ncbi:MAG: SUMF1/EgtB/PvdO family nonheme iron enzyme [Thermoguttaceae bacterium]|nr:SUMF1/EgtB/PvdO family nonheme iron enzyme [Thermoguttaceae bacterium]
MSARYLSLLLVLSLFIAPTAGYASNDGSPDPVALRMAIEDLTETFGDEYPDGESYLAELDALEAASDAPDFASKLFDLQKRATLANPLLAQRRVLAIKRGANQIATPTLNAYVTEDVPKNIGSQIVSIDPVSGGYDVLFDSEGKTIVDTDLEFDAERLMFTAPGANGRWALHELALDANGKSGGVKQLSPDIDEIDFFDSCYLPDGDVVYGSNATFQGLPCESGRKQMALLYRMNPETKEIRQLTFEQDSDWCPTMMENGRVMYLRWEYTDTPHFFYRILFSMNPDGTNQTAYYGSNSYWPNSLFYAKPIPGDPARFVGTVSGHHVGRPGRLILFDPRLGRHETEGVIQSIPGREDVVENEIQDYLYQNRWPKFLQVDPLGTSEDDGAGRYFLVSANRGDGWGIWLVDIFDNMTPIVLEKDAAFTDPILLTPRKRPPVLSERTNPNQKDASVFLADVYFGAGLPDVPRGTIKSLRVFEYHFAYPFSGHNDVIGIESSWDVKRVLGVVPVEEDGSAAFRIPANVPVAIQPLDAEGRAVQLMRSWLVGKQGESVSCFGCHENANDISPNDRPIASRIDPHELTPWRGPTRGFDFLREVQPVLDKYCIGCHDGSAESREKFGLGADETFPNFKDYTLETVEDGAQRQIGPFYRSYMALRPYVSAPGPESDVHIFQPGEYHASVSPVIQMLKKGHRNVQLDDEAYDRLYTWIDLNAPCYGTWTEAHRHWQNKVLLDWMQITHEDQMASIAKYRELRNLYSKEFADVDEDPEGDAIDEQEAYDQVEARRAANPPIVPDPEVRPEFKPFVVENFAPFANPGEASARQFATAPNGVVGKSLTVADGKTFDVRWIPAGDFFYGSDGESIAEYPKRPVRIENGFWMASTEITNELYALFDPSHDSRYVDELTKDHARPGLPANLPKQPVSRVGYDAAVRFCAWLEEKLTANGALPEGWEVRLPTEQEWEYAARSGSSGAFWFGDVKTDFANYANLADKSLTKMRVGQGSVDYWRKAQVDDGAIGMRDVGSYAPNAFGLYDMIGNVAEWTNSPMTKSGAESGSVEPTDKPGDLERLDRVVRGGSWKDWPERATSSFRVGVVPYFHAADVGFRPVIAPKAN